jgi:hypothetical protein
MITVTGSSMQGVFPLLGVLWLAVCCPAVAIEVWHPLRPRRHSTSQLAVVWAAVSLTASIVVATLFNMAGLVAVICGLVGATVFAYRAWSDRQHERAGRFETGSGPHGP